MVGTSIFFGESWPLNTYPNHHQTTLGMTTVTAGVFSRKRLDLVLSVVGGVGGLHLPCGKLTVCELENHHAING